MAGLFGGLFGKGTAKAEDRAGPPYPQGLSDAEIDAVFERATTELDAKTAAHVGTWHLDRSTWAADLEAGLITFTNDLGWTITAPVQVVGTYNSNDGTFLWGWDHPSVPAPVARDAALARDFGEAQGLEMLTTRQVEMDEDAAWELTALAVHLAGAQGAYRGPSGSTFVFMTFGEPTISKA